jgi:signal transduction histidine kinase
MNKRQGRLDQDDIGILSIISAFTAISIEEARLFEEAKLAEVVRVLGDMGHDVKNLLMPVLCGASLLETEVDELFSLLPNINVAKAKMSQNMCHEVIHMLKTNSHRIQDRVKEIADCVKGLSSPPNFAPCQVKDVVDEVIETLRLLAQEKDISLQSEGLDTLPKFQADERRLFNAFYNLIHNALAEVPPGGSITVHGEIAPTDGGLLLSVTDTGRGMPAEIRDSLFSAKAMSRKPGGTGLGTKIVKDVVDAHGGKISVESEVGLGTTFSIQFPKTPPSISSSKGRP